MLLRELVTPASSWTSYLVGCPATGRGIVVDPHPEIGPSLLVAGDAGLRITHVVLTAVREGGVVGARRLAHVVRAPLLAHTAAAIDLPYGAVDDAEDHEVGRLRVVVLPTPGCTPDGLSVVVSPAGAGAGPCCVFTGDVLFRGGVGRPADTLADERWSLAEQLHRSLFDRLLALPDHVAIHPARHAAGRPLTSTIGRERRESPALRCASRLDFVRLALADPAVGPSWT